MWFSVPRMEPKQAPLSAASVVASSVAAASYIRSFIQRLYSAISDAIRGVMAMPKRQAERCADAAACPPRTHDRGDVLPPRHVPTAPDQHSLQAALSRRGFNVAIARKFENVIGKPASPCRMATSENSP